MDLCYVQSSMVDHKNSLKKCDCFEYWHLAYNIWPISEKMTKSVTLGLIIFFTCPNMYFKAPIIKIQCFFLSFITRKLKLVIISEIAHILHGIAHDTEPEINFLNYSLYQDLKFACLKEVCTLN